MSQGFTIQPPVGDYEALRVTDPKNNLILAHRRERAQHLTLSPEAEALFYAWRKRKKAP